MSSMRESLAKALGQTDFVPKIHVHSEAFELEMAEDSVSINVKAIAPEEVRRRFQSLEIFFLELRRKVRDLTKDPNWNIRYASQIHEVNLPFLHNGVTLTIMMDPMLPYRNPIKTLSTGGSITLCSIPSQIYYAKPKEEAVALANVQRKESTSFRSKTRGPKPDASKGSDEAGADGGSTTSGTASSGPEAELP